MLDIKSNEPGLFWIAQLLYLLPFPMYWSTENNPSEKNSIHFTYRVSILILTSSKSTPQCIHHHFVTVITS